MNPKLHTLVESAVIVAAIATMPVVILEVQDSSAGWLSWADWAKWTVFAAALAVMLAGSGPYLDVERLNRRVLR